MPMFRRDSLEGLRLGVIDNTKPNFDILCGAFGRWLEEHHSAAPLVRRRKRAPTMPAPDDVYDEFAREYDVVLTGSGD